MRVVLFALAVAAAAGAHGAETKNPNEALDRPISLGELTPTPEMWFYQQERRMAENPRVAVRQKAAFRAAQRQLRLASSRWYGVDNSRPIACTTPFQGITYGPSFAGGRDPNLWPSASQPTIIVSGKRPEYRSAW